MRIMFLNHSYKRHSPALESHILKLLYSYASPGTEFELAYPEDLGGGEVLSLLEERKALSGLHHILETPALVKKAIEAERLGFDAVIQSNTFDPGVEASRLAVRIPVVGLLRASLHFAASLCDRFGVIVPLQTHIPHTLRLVQSYGMSAFLSGIRTVNLYDTGDLSAYHDTVIERTLAAARELIAEGAQAILPLGGKIYPYVVEPRELEPELGVPVINTKAVGVRFAELLVVTKCTHSAKAYPWSAGITPDAISRRSRD
ncbi:MAG TPA: aspartate/glutamate racemase family protein [candidate division Zixibacteria bacterium]|nr:aspartate/glutamate racemase family protein [candidate division Zixibacteria bacterium]